MQPTQEMWRSPLDSSTWWLLQWNMNIHIKWDKWGLKIASCHFRTSFIVKWVKTNVWCGGCLETGVGLGLRVCGLHWVRPWAHAYLCSGWWSWSSNPGLLVCFLKQFLQVCTENSLLSSFVIPYKTLYNFFCLSFLVRWLCGSFTHFLNETLCFLVVVAV